jgi:hypothetical protein
MVMTVFVAGCGSAHSDGGSPQPSAASRLTAVCDQSVHEAITAQARFLPSSEFAVLGRLIEEAAEETEKIDERTAAKVRSLARSEARAAALSNIAAGEETLRTVVSVVRSHGIRYSDLPSGLLSLLVSASGGCFVTPR